MKKIPYSLSQEHQKTFLKNRSILRTKYTAGQIRRKILALAHRINRMYLGSEVIIVGVLKGSLFFFADLAREIKTPMVMDFIQVSSYRGRTASGSKICLTKDIETDITGKHVLIIDDIVDTGRTITALRKHFERKRPLSVNFCALVDKRARREADVVIEFPGFRTKSGFLVGYGMDFAEAGRELRHIYELHEKT